jgi:hypothetical protein
LFTLDLENNKVLIDSEKLHEFLNNRIISRIDNFFTLLLKEDYFYKIKINYNKNNRLIYDVNLKLGIKTTKEMIEVNYIFQGKKKGMFLENMKFNTLSISASKDKKNIKMAIRKFRKIISKECDIYLKNIENNSNLNETHDFS